MIDDNVLILNSLIVLVNTSRGETNDTLIARAIVENRDHLDDLSMDDLARRYHISQPTISRFVKKLGYKSFSELKKAVALSDYFFRDALPPASMAEPKKVIQEVHDDISAAVDEILDLNENSLMDFVYRLRNARNIYFMGSELSMAIIHVIQHKLLGMGKSAYTILLQEYQNEILDSLNESHLLVCISVADRWTQLIGEEALAACKCEKILLAGHPAHDKKNTFDHVYNFSKRADNIGYNALMTYVMALFRLL